LGEVDDHQLLQRYVQLRCPDAFGILVARHIGWVESVVRRQVKDRHLAEDVTQAVFIILARKAAKIPPGTMLSAWLFRVARYAANDAVKQESRRRRRMERVAEMQTVRAGSADQTMLNATATMIEPELDDALACLSDADRRVVLLRFYEDKSMAELGAALGISEDAAKQRVSRALKRLRDQLQRKGIKIATVAAVVLLLMRSSGVARAATAARGASLLEFTKVATGQTEAAGRSLQVAQATLKSIAAAHVRLLAAMSGAGLALSIAIGVFTPVLGQMIHPLLDDMHSAMTWSTPGNLTFGPIQQQPQASEPAAREDVTRLWVGTSNERAWPVLPRWAPAMPLELRTLSGTDAPVAVAQDNLGQLWYRRIGRDAEPAPVSALTSDGVRYRSYEELNPYLGILPDQSADALLPDDAWASARHVSSDGVEWQPVDPPNEGGAVVLPFSPLNPGGGGGLSGLGGVAVPEPGFIALATSAGIVGLWRRRNRPRL
jgi:RNA polymerase sigma factor (sigma-70 family)